ncbi:MAG TPA: histidine kinase [Thermoanaerobaculia bacterium]|nr:histidine kinase [Thermoanaerobaculia bacterium]
MQRRSCHCNDTKHGSGRTKGTVPVTNPQASPLPDLRRLALIALGITTSWIIAGIFFGTQHKLMIEARRMEDDLTERLIAMTISMLVWACLTPLVIHLADLFPLRKPHRLRSILVLVPVGFFLAAGRASIDGFLPMMLEGMPITLTDYRSSVLSLFHTHLLFTILLIGIGNYLRLQREEADRRRSEARAEAELAQARLWRLRADLHPHFLFNALNSVAAVVHTRPDDARQMLQQLSELLHRSLASQDAPEVPLGNELELMSRYLDVLKMRFGDRLEATIEVADETLRAAAIPPLLLQPLVENAIVHGIAHRRDGGRLAVRVTAVGPWLQLEVRDNGPGCAPEAVFRREGLGVPNVRARLESVYGQQQSLVYREEGEEFIAEIRIPLRRPNAAELSRTA